MRRSVLSSAVAASVAVSMTLSTVVAAPAVAQSSLPGATVSTIVPTTSAAATTAPTDAPATDAPATSATTTPVDTTAPTTTPAPVGGSSGPQAMLAQGAGIGVAIGAAVMALYIGAIAMVPSARPVLLSILPAQMRADVEGMLARKGM